MIRPSERLNRLPAYAFAKLGRRIAELNAEGKDVIRMDMGSPDLPPPPAVIEALYRSAQDPTHHGYPGFFGTPSFRQAIATYYKRRFQVELDPNTEILPLIGSKEGIVNFHLAYVDPGDIVLVPDPGYPSYEQGTHLASGEVYPVPLYRENGWLPDLDAIPEQIAQKAKIFWLNYPNNPTGATADLDFFARVVEFAHRYNILICHDNPYCDVVFDGYVAPSILQVEGAKEVAVEFNSFSKSYNMAGWRVAMVVGNAEVIANLGQIKTNIDSGIFRGIQDAATVALLETDESWLVERNRIYQERRDIVLGALAEIGIQADRPRAGLYVWASVPDGVETTAFATRLLEEAGVSVAPGTMYGKQGEGYVRFSLGQDTDRIREAMERIKKLSW